MSLVPWPAYDVFPAQAGMIPNPFVWARWSTRFPRASRDDPVQKLADGELLGFSPRKQG